MEKRVLININNLSTQFGILAGIGISSFLLMFQIAGQDYSPFAKLSKYILFSAVIGLALLHYRKKIEGDIFKKGISFSFKLSFVAGLILVVTNLILFVAAPSYAFSKYTIVPDTFLEWSVVSFSLFFETLVFGNIIAFIFLQMIKR